MLGARAGQLPRVVMSSTRDGGTEVHVQPCADGTLEYEFHFACNLLTKPKKLSILYLVSFLIDNLTAFPSIHRLSSQVYR